MKDVRRRFGFRATPFTRELRVEDRFTLSAFDEALEALLSAVENRQSAALIAPAGTGKTALVRALIARLPEARYRVRYVKKTGLSKRGGRGATADGRGGAGRGARRRAPVAARRAPVEPRRGRCVEPPPDPAARERRRRRRAAPRGRCGR